MVGAQTKVKKDKRTVTDYFNLLIGKDLKKEGITPKFLVQDTKNGYIKTEISSETTLEVVLFRKKNGEALIVSGMTSCGPVCQTEIEAYEFEGNNEKIVTEKIIPAVSDEEMRKIYGYKKKNGDEGIRENDLLPVVWELPRYGRTIKVRMDTTIAPSKIMLYELHWKDDKFTVVR